MMHDDRRWRPRCPTLAHAGYPPCVRPGRGFSVTVWFAIEPIAIPRSRVNSPIQLAVSQESIIGGTCFNTQTDQALPVQGAVDYETQRAAWTIGDHINTVIETGVYDLTNDEAPVLVHFGGERTQQLPLVRLPE